MRYVVAILLPAVVFALAGAPQPWGMMLSGLSTLVILLLWRVK